MSLGPDRTACLNALKDALRSVAGDAVDKPPTEANIAAIAEAIYSILTVDADVSVTQADNASFWDWLTTVGAHAAAGPPPVSSLNGKVT